jgi:hypothetical protein
MKNYHHYKDCIDACLKCAALCNHCAASCTLEKDVQMMSLCIKFDMECAAICYVAAQLMSLGSEKADEMCRLCAEICETCGAECANHDNGHCRECAEACKKCAAECRKMVA